MDEPATSRASTPAACGCTWGCENAIVANVIAAIVHTPAERPYTPSMKLTMFMSATSPRLVRAYAGDGLRSQRWMRGRVSLVTSTTNATYIVDANRLSAL